MSIGNEDDSSNVPTESVTRIFFLSSSKSSHQKLIFLVREGIRVKERASSQIQIKLVEFYNKSSLDEDRWRSLFCI